ncbi:MAG: hypothetical protein EBZ61_10400, partial [Micrococcales bacterium]|nr:hypothetical protein [Micrococcales bacterium]
MTKLTFKRIALVVVTALGLGLVASGPSSAAPTASSDTLTLSASTATIAAGETASVTVTQSAIMNLDSDSLAVRVLNQSAPAGGNGSLGFYVTDSANARIWTRANPEAFYKLEAQLQSDYTDGDGTTPNLGTALGSLPINAYLGAPRGTSSSVASSATYRLSFINPTVAGTYVFRIFPVNTSLLYGSTDTYSVTASSSLTWTVTVTANASNVGAVNSKFWLNRVDEYQAYHMSAQAFQNPESTSYRTIETDSALVVNAGATTGYTAHAVITPVIMNSSDTKISTQTSARVNESMTITISGPGALRSYGARVGATTGPAGFSSNSGLYAKQVTIAYNETAVVYSDGTVGTATISAYIGASAISSKLITQGTKSITFVGRAVTFDVTGFTAGQRAGGNAPYRSAADSATSVATGTLGAGLLPAIRFVAKDSAGNAVTTASLSTDKGDASTNFYAISSDTSIVAAGEVSATNTFATNTARRNAALTCNYAADLGYWYCTGRVFDSGTVTLTIVDSRTITANGNSTTATTDAVYKSAPFSVTFAGDANTGTIAFDKTSYNVNEKATLTLTAKDGAGRTVADASYTGLFTSLSWKGGAPTFGNDASANAAGGRFTDLVTYLGTTGPSFVGGVDTALVFMPTVAGTYTLVGKTGIETATKDLLTITVTDPTQSAIKASADAATTAAEAATDAAAEAIDAANA